MKKESVIIMGICLIGMIVTKVIVNKYDDKEFQNIVKENINRQMNR